MTTATMGADQRRNIVFLGGLGEAASVHAKAATAEQPTGSLIIEKKPIFRSGSFADSMGREHDWEALHVNQMVDHFELLSSRGNFDDVPIRKGHPDMGGIFGGESRNRMDELVGYITAVYSEERVNPVDQQTYTYLLADLEIIEETAKRNVQSGLWRNMSAEVGSQITNSRAEYWPCIVGVAYVDQPAVEGLKNHSKSESNFSLITEDQMTTTDPTNPNPPVPSDKSTVSFSIGGKATSDYAAVQAHITKVETENATLREFRTATEEQVRENYCNSLVTANKITAPQLDSYIKYAKSLSSATFSEWTGLMDATPAQTVTAPQGAGFGAEAPGQNGPADEKSERILDLKGMISMHKSNNLSAEKIKALGSYKELVQLDPSFSL